MPDHSTAAAALARRLAALAERATPGGDATTISTARWSAPRWLRSTTAPRRGSAR